MKSAAPPPPAAQRIRDARAVDAAEIARLSAQLGYPAAAETFAQRLIRLIASDLHAVLVAEGQAEGSLHGFIAIERRLTLELGERVEIAGLVVEATARRSGTGRALVMAAERWAAGCGVAELVVRSNVLRSEAHPFYRRLGYACSKTQRVYRKRLNPHPGTAAAPPGDNVEAE